MPKFIEFVDRTPTAMAGVIKPQRPEFAIINKKSGRTIARIEYYAPWRQYISVFNTDTVWSHDCLDDIAAFIRNIPKAAR